MPNFRNLLSRFLTAARIVGVFAAVLALMGQIAIGAVVPAPAQDPGQDNDALEAALFICHTGGPNSPSQPAPSHHRADCALCPLCQAQLHDHAILTPPLLTQAAPVVLTLRVRGAAQSRAPPATFVDSRYPRGPPVLA